MRIAHDEYNSIHEDHPGGPKDAKIGEQHCRR